MYKMNDAEVSFWNFSGHQNDIAPKTYLSMNGNTLSRFQNDNKKRKNNKLRQRFFIYASNVDYEYFKKSKNIV